MEMNGQLHRVMVSLLMLLILMGQVSTQYQSPNSNRAYRLPGCVTDQPCGFLAVFHVPNSIVPSVNKTPTCTCPGSSPSCSEDWDSNSDMKVVQELRTVDNNNITLSMMFCAPVLPLKICIAVQTALHVSESSNLPTEVKFHCRCPDGHLVISETSKDDRFRPFFSYVCASQQSVCLTHHVCSIKVPATDSITYPCSCPSGFSCPPR